MFQIGDTQIKDVYLGSQRLESVYIGNNLVWTTIPINGLALHLDASDSSTITKDDSNRVSEWYDKSANNHIATAQENDRPIFAEDSQNGLSSIQFTDDKLTIPHNISLEIVDGMSIFIVKKSTNVSKGRQNILDKDYDGEFAFSLEPNGTISRYWGRPDYAAFGYANTNSNDITSLISTIRDLSYSIGSRLWIDGIEINNTAIGRRGAIPQSFSEPITIGKGYTNVGYEGLIYEILIYDRALSNSERMQVETYLSEKWGITL